jgi:6-phosphogluconate dehydrogenase
MKIGYIGLGRMGLGMVTLLTEKGHEVTATDKDPKARASAEEAGALVRESAAEVVQSLSAPRVVWLMVPQQFVDDVISEITPHLEEGDTVLDGGNSQYTESMRRGAELDEAGVHYMDAGVSGGPEGARQGACVMVGGDKEAFEANEELFRDIAAPDAYKYMGESGAGHFVKMVHNGIEYGMMEAIAEGFNIMRESDFKLSMTDIADIYQHESVVTSRLVGWLKKGFETYGEDLEEVDGAAGASGEGKWTVDIARQLNAEAGSIQHALDMRIESQKNPSYLGKLIQTMRNMFGGHAGRTDITS